MKNISTIILAAGNSSRFKHNKSKIFQDLSGLSIIGHVYNIAEKISKDKVIFVCNRNNINELKKKFPKANFCIQKNQKGTADAITSIKSHLKTKDILILFGDVPLITYKSINKLILNFYKNKSIGSMIAFKSKNPFGYGRVDVEGKYVKSVVEEVNASKDEKKINLCNSGVLICDSKLLFKNLYKISNKNINKEKYLPDIFSIFYTISKGFTFTIGSEKEMSGINTIDDLIKLDKMMQKIIKSKIINSGVIIQQPETNRFSFDTKIKQGSIIEPFVNIKIGVSIGKNVIIKSHSVLEECKINDECMIGPSARIRPYSKISKNVKIGNYVEIKNSIISENTSISHLSYIGDSHVGKNVNIGAGTITCNYDGKNKNKTVIEDNVFVGSNCSLVAPIKIGNNSIIGAGSVITKDIPQNHLALERSEVKILKKNRKK